MLERFLKWIEVLAPTFLAALIILAAGTIFTKITIKIMTKGLKKSKIEPTAHGFLISLVKTILYMFVFIIFLSVLKVPMTSIIAAVSAAGLAIGLALQNSLSNIAGGFIILFAKPFKKGDFVEIGSDIGKVDEISILYTRLLTSDNKAVHIPNGNITSTSVTNYSEENLRRLDLNFSIGYDDDYKKAISLILDFINNHPLSLKKPDEPLVRMTSHDASAINIVSRVWVKNENYHELRFDMLEGIKDAFDKNGISIPYNQLDVRITNN